MADRRKPYDRMRGTRPLQALRLDRGLTQRELAERAGLQVQTIKRFERNDPSVSRAALCAISYALGCTFEYVAL